MSKYNQIATYWAQNARDGFGKMSYSAPVQVDVHWQDKQILFMNEAGEQEMSSSIVYLKSQDVGSEDYLYLGTSVESSPADQAGAKKIKGFSKVPSVGGSKFTRKAWL